MADEQIQTPAAPTGEAAAPKKNKKVNRMLADELSQKISDLDGKNQNKSRYYKHLQARKEEAQKKA